MPLQVMLLVNRLKTDVFFVNIPLKLLSPESFFQLKKGINIVWRTDSELRPDPLGELTAHSLNL